MYMSKQKEQTDNWPERHTDYCPVLGQFQRHSAKKWAVKLIGHWPVFNQFNDNYEEEAEMEMFPL